MSADLPRESAPSGSDPSRGASDPSERADRCLASLRTFFSAHPQVLDWGIAPARPSPSTELLKSWVGQGHHAGMEYMAARLNERMDPRAFHPWARSAVVFAFPYAAPLDAPAPGPTSSASPTYKVAAYARGGDYHHVARALLSQVEAHLRADSGLSDLRFYGFVDTAPVFERDLASEAGLGWRGKNCCTLNRKHGSAFHLAGFFLDVDLPAGLPVEDFCGGCTRCLDQCPTNAFVGPGRLDANKCISYWTIEAKGAVPPELSERFEGWIFGCDVCQQVCPWNYKHLNRAGPTSGEARTSTASAHPSPIESGSGSGAAELSTTALGDRPRSDTDNPFWPDSGAVWTSLLRKGGGFQSRFKSSPLTRAGRRSLLRNVAVAARNLRDTSVAEPLRALLAEESDPSVVEEIRRTLSALEKKD